MLSQSRLKFLIHIVDTCSKYNFKLQLEDKEAVGSENLVPNCAGYFDNENKILAIAMLQPEWFETLLHEYCHLLQRLNKKYINDHMISIFWNWLLDKDATLTNLTLFLSADYILSYEQDCERKAVKLIRENSAWKINIKKYIQKANAYLCLYPALTRHRNWDVPSPSIFKEIYSLVPNNRILTLKEIWQMNQGGRIKKLIDRLCFNS